MRTDGFGRGVVFGALAAAAWLPFRLLSAPLIGVHVAAEIHLVAICSLYVAGLGPRGSARAGAALLVAGAGACVAAFSGSLVLSAAVLTALIGLARAVLLRPAATSRALIVEAVIGGASLCAAGFLMGLSGLSYALSVWGYFLTQSFFFLIRETRACDPRRDDPFERAHRLASALLERG